MSTTDCLLNVRTIMPSDAGFPVSQPCKFRLRILEGLIRPRGLVERWKGLVRRALNCVVSAFPQCTQIAHASLSTLDYGSGNCVTKGVFGR